MSYTTAVTDRTATDIANRTSKAFMNIATWARIYENSRLARDLAAIMLGTPIAFTTIAAPTITSIPTALDLFALTSNIEILRLASGVSGTTAIFYNWVAGPDQLAPSYVHVNQWESTIDAIWTYYGGPALDVNKVLSADLVVTTGTKYIVVDSLDANGYNITVQDGATLAII
jgi:hypothetical protein